mgnify:CR=1 FL=1|tara:strand:- start:292 stop:516 length:225 start_codon:yes stop_codon:yes gene_type:complete
MQHLIEKLNRRRFLARAGSWAVIAAIALNAKRAFASSMEASSNHKEESSQAQGPTRPGFSFPAPSDVALYLEIE